MKHSGTITKVEATNEESQYNVVGDEHQVEFDSPPAVGDRFYVHEKDRSIDGWWSTSKVQDIKEMEDHMLINTKYSVYKLIY